MTNTGTASALQQLWQALSGGNPIAARFEENGQGDLPSSFAVSDLASASIGAAGLALAEWCKINGHDAGTVEVGRRLASLWFSMTIKPVGWSLPPVWDVIAGDYRTADGWIRLHTNAAHHRAAALSVLKTEPDREILAEIVRHWTAEALETAVVDAGGCAARMMSEDEWRSHPQGMAVAGEPLVHRDDGGDAISRFSFDPERPLAGIRVLDLTRVLAGPVATRFLAGFGAEVLRLDPPGWDEANVAPEVTLGKRCATLDLKSTEGRAQFRVLLASADILVSGYRSDALERLGLGASDRQNVRPGLIDVSLDAYGWSGLWARRRGFDSLVQMSAGIAERGMRDAGAEKPVPLPVQALDHATGYLLAAMALRGLAERASTGRGSHWRTSLARMALLLTGLPVNPGDKLPPATDDDYADLREETVWGPALRMKPPLRLGSLLPSWDRPPGPLGTAPPAWL